MFVEGFHRVDKRLVDLAVYSYDAFLVISVGVGIFKPMPTDAVRMVFEERGGVGVIEFACIFIFEDAEASSLFGGVGSFIRNLHGVEFSYEKGAFGPL